MKKTVVAIAVTGLMTAAAGANAAVVYNQNGTSVDVHGRVQSTLNGGYEVNNTKVQNTNLSATGRLGADATFKLNDQVDAILASEWDVQADANDEDIFNARNIYVGFDAHQYGKVTIGQNDTALYTGVTAITDKFNEWGNNAVVGGGREAGIVTYDMNYMGLGVHLSGGAHSEKANTSHDMMVGDKAAKGYDKGGFSNFVTAAVGAKVDEKVSRNNTYALALDYTFDFKDAGALMLAGGYQSTDFYGSNNGMNNWALGASYTWQGLYFGGVYNQSKVDSKGQSYKAKGYEIALTYAVNDQWKLLSGYNKLTSKDFTGASENAFTNEALLGVQYNFTPNLKAYTEYKIASKVAIANGTGGKVTTADPDNQWVVSLQYNF